jgi:hypothetical protein
MKVAHITEQQAEQLKGNIYFQSVFFNPVQDADDNWCISEIVIQKNENTDFAWVNELVADKEYKLKKINI